MVKPKYLNQLYYFDAKTECSTYDKPENAKFLDPKTNEAYVFEEETKPKKKKSRKSDAESDKETPKKTKKSKESESDSTSFISFTSEEQLQTVKEEVQPQIKQEINDDELADEEDNTIDNLNNSDSKKKLTVQIGLNKVQNLSSEGHNIRIKIKRRNAFGPNKKVKILIKQNGKIVEKTVNSKISKLHIVVNKKQQNQQDEEHLHLFWSYRIQIMEISDQSHLASSI